MNATTEPAVVDAGFDAFYRRHFQHRVAQVAKTVGNHFDAEDIVQVSFAELAEGWEKAEHPERLLSTIIHRQVCKHWRRQPFAKDVVVTALGDEAEQIRARVADPAVVAEQRDTIRRVGKEITPIEREIVAGRFHQDTAAVIALASKTRPDELRQRGRWMEQRMSTLIEPAQTGLVSLDK